MEEQNINNIQEQQNNIQQNITQQNIQQQIEHQENNSQQNLQNYQNIQFEEGEGQQIQLLQDTYSNSQSQRQEDQELEQDSQKQQSLQQEEENFEDYEEIDLTETQSNKDYNNSDDEESQEEEKIIFTKEQLIEGLKNKKFERVTFLTGAGISVSAGIPDFRTPGTGLYSQLEKYNLPDPQAIFDMYYFRYNPKPFYTLAREFLKGGMEPTLSHKFIKQFQDQNIMQLNVTQNIDGLEIDAGIKTEKLIQAHGHFRSAHCTNQECKKEFDMKIFNEYVNNKKILICDECRTYVKPDIVFFHEDVTEGAIRRGAMSVLTSDLVFIMGTSLQVHPFNLLAAFIPKSTPTVLMNMDDLGFRRSNLLFLQGDLDKNIKEIMEEVGWQVPNVKKVEVQPLQNPEAIEDFDNPIEHETDHLNPYYDMHEWESCSQSQTEQNQEDSQQSQEQKLYQQQEDIKDEQKSDTQSLSQNNLQQASQEIQENQEQQKLQQQQQDIQQQQTTDLQQQQIQEQ